MAARNDAWSPAGAMISIVPINSIIQVFAAGCAVGFIVRNEPDLRGFGP